MLDVIGAVFAAALYTAIIGVLIGYSHVGIASKLGAAALAAAWCGIITAAAALGGLLPGTLGPVPVGLLPFGGFLALLFGAWFLSPEFRGAVFSVPLPVLLGLHAGRLGGLFFVLLYMDGRLSAPFAPAAGFGDMAAGALAIPLAASLALGWRLRLAWVGIWNGLGALDLIVAVSLGALSAPGTPFRVFIEGPGTLAMTTLPWAFIPAMLVPLFLLIHFAIAVKLRMGVQANCPVVA
jgi:hypothetical protein